jgi:hypothetical protein
MAAAGSIDEYIAEFPTDVQPVLQEIRRTCHAAVPGAQEAISYRIPTLRRDGKPVVYFAGFQHQASIRPPTATRRSSRPLPRTGRARGRCHSRSANPCPTSSSAGSPACSPPGWADPSRVCPPP